jgi:hypothetical protein
MYICLHCGHEFDEIDRKHYDHGTGVWEEYCPNCGSEDFEEASECVECGAVKCADNLINGMCEDCINIAAEDMRQAYEYGADRTEVVEINGVLAMAFSKVQIEAILTNYLMNNGDFAAECKRFALDDKYDFTDWLSERRKK